MAQSLSDLRYAYFGGGAAAEYQYLLDRFNLGETALSDAVRGTQFNSNSGDSIIDRFTADAQNLAITSGHVRISFFVAPKTKQYSKLAYACGSVAAATVTTIKYGLFQIETNGDVTRIAITANNTALLNAIDTVFEEPFLSPVSLTAGQRYGAAVFVSATTTPTFVGKGFGSAANAVKNLDPKLNAQLAGQTDIPASIVAASLANSTQYFWAELRV